MKIIIDEQIKIVSTSAGNPKTWTKFLKEQGCTVMHVVSSSAFAKKAEDAGVDCVVAEGFEAGGHNGREETSTLTLIPMVRATISIPLVAAGGIATGRGMLAAMALGADGIQIGSRFAASKESSAHINFKKAIVETPEGGTQLTLKELAPVRLIKNKFYHDLQNLYLANPTVDDLKNLLGRARAKRGMFEGDLVEGELEIGQISGLINEILPVKTIIGNIISEFENARIELNSNNFRF
jgi:enoyl-[acyl-carrier protein] reductase II